MNRRQFIEKSVLINGWALMSVSWLHPISEMLGLKPKMYFMPIQEDNPSIVRWEHKCKGCEKCLEACAEIQQVYGTYEASKTKHVCIHCGTCISACDKKALTEKYHWEDVLGSIDDPSKIVIASISPSVRVAIGDYFGLPKGTYIPENMVGACKALGFDYVLDTNFSADLTIIEEAKELQERIENNNDLPQFTSCCPAWVSYVEIYYPDLLKHLSSVKSPNLMQGALVKSYFAKKNKIDPKNIIHVAITPCTAKKYEITREELITDGLKSIDFALTTNEFALMLKDRKIDLLAKKDNFDSIMSVSSGGGVIFGNTGGVASAATRTLYYNLTGKNPPNDLLDIQDIHELNGIKEATVTIGDKTLKVAVCYEMRNAKILLEQLRKGTCKYQFVEVMACKGGCIGGAGQHPEEGSLEKRIASLKSADLQSAIRYSHENPEIKTVYKKFLGKVGGSKAKHFLHTTFNDNSNLLLASNEAGKKVSSIELVG